VQLAEAEREVKKEAFERALAVPDEPPVSDEIVLEEITVDSSYQGPRMEGGLIRGVDRWMRGWQRQSG
jgi:hypothetical protein